jgi:hypothetical protein
VLIKPLASYVVIPLGVTSSMFPANNASTIALAARWAAGFL